MSVSANVSVSANGRKRGDTQGDARSKYLGILRPVNQYGYIRLARDGDNLMFYAQSTSTVTSEQETDVSISVFYAQQSTSTVTSDRARDGCK